MNPRESAQWAMLCWVVIVLVCFGAQRFADPARRGRVESEGWHQLQARFLDETRAAASGERRDLLELYRDGLDGFRAIPARLLPVPDLSPQRHGALIDRGRLDGVVPGQGVVGRSGVIGRIVEVGDERSRLVFSDDPEFRASFAVEGKGRGIAAGGPRRGELHPMLRLDAFTFEVGDLLLTSGGDGRFPRNLVIGVVRSTRLPVEATRIEPPPGCYDPQEVVILALPDLGDQR